MKDGSEKCLHGQRTGAVVVFNLDGRIQQTIEGLDRPNNIDVEYELMLNGRPTDIAVVTERYRHRLKVYAIDRGPAAPLRDIGADGGIPVLAGLAGEAAEPMGIALYRRPQDGAIFAVVAPKTGGMTRYLWQYRVSDNGQGLVAGRLVRRFGNFSGAAADNEIEAVAVDDSLGYVYYADEDCCIRKWPADPDTTNAARELAAFGRTGYQGDREGLAIYKRADGTGYIVSSDQRPQGTVLHLFPREGIARRPHVHPELIAIPTDADSTDGLEVVSTNLGPRFRDGLLIAMNSAGRNFLLYPWADIRRWLPQAR